MRRDFDYYAEHGEHFLRPQKIQSPAGDATLINEPLKVTRSTTASATFLLEEAR